MVHTHREPTEETDMTTKAKRVLKEVQKEPEQKELFDPHSVLPPEPPPPKPEGPPKFEPPADATGQSRDDLFEQFLKDHYGWALSDLTRDLVVAARTAGNDQAPATAYRFALKYFRFMNDQGLIG
jgi:hypothetical protein